MPEPATALTDDSFFDLQVTRKHADRHGVDPRIHRRDFVFMHHIEGPSRSPFEVAVQYYIDDGGRSAAQLDQLIRKYLPDRSDLRLLEFAAGYGCVTRHLKKLEDRYNITACDIHPEAVEYIRDFIRVDAVLSDRVPERLPTGGRFDVVFALSFFTHMPPSTFGRWMNALLDQLNDNGLLIFTTHGRPTQPMVNVTSLGEEGIWFRPETDQYDLPTEDYGATIVRPHFVFDAFAHRRDCTLLQYQEGFWWGIQDLHVFRKLDGGDFTNASPHSGGAAGAAEIAALQATVKNQREEIDLLRNSTSWKITQPLRRLRTLLGTP